MRDRTDGRRGGALHVSLDRGCRIASALFAGGIRKNLIAQGTSIKLPSAPSTPTPNFPTTCASPVGPQDDRSGGLVRVDYGHAQLDETLRDVLLPLASARQTDAQAMCVGDAAWVAVLQARHA